MTVQAVRQFTDIGVTLGTITIDRRSGIVVSVLLRHKGVTLGTITAGGHILVTLVTEPLLISSRLVVASCDVFTVTLGAVCCGKCRTRH